MGLWVIFNVLCVHTCLLLCLCPGTCLIVCSVLYERLSAFNAFGYLCTWCCAQIESCLSVGVCVCVCVCGVIVCACAFMRCAEVGEASEARSDELCQRWFFTNLSVGRGPLMASSLGWLTDLLALGGSCLPYLVAEGGGWWRKGSGRGGHRCSVYMQGREVSAPECHGANTDHLKDSKRASESSPTGRIGQIHRERVCERECVCVSVHLCVWAREGLITVHTLVKP